MHERRFIYPEPDELTFVVRAAGERTEEACVAQLRRQLPSESQLTVIHERPFSRAVTRTFELGIASGRPWLVAVDADLLLLDDAVERAREICGKMAPEAFCATPLFLCKTVGGFASRGLHCYRASLLDEALGLTGQLDPDLRPESRYYGAMKARGYTREVYAKVLGLHEHEQSYRHIYIKSLLRARKDDDAEAFRRSLEVRAECDPDAMVALWGFEDAIDGGPDEYDWSAPLPSFEARMERAGLAEKPPLDASEIEELALREILAHDYVTDSTTEPWVRDMHAFERGAPGLIESVRNPPRFTPTPAGSA